MIPSTFRRFERMSRREDFSAARKDGRRKAGRCLVLWARPRGETPPRAARLGLVVSRRNGIAARRALFKRRVREAFRRNKDRFPRGWDFVVSPKTPAPGGFPPPYADIAGDFLGLAAAAVAR